MPTGKYRFIPEGYESLLLGQGIDAQQKRQIVIEYIKYAGLEVITVDKSIILRERSEHGVSDVDLGIWIKDDDWEKRDLTALFELTDKAIREYHPSWNQQQGGEQ